MLHFDDWAKANGVARRSGEDNQSLGHRLLAALESGAPHSRFFNSILVDEAQDFEISWFKCLLEAIDDPDDGDLIIVGDGSQGLYGDYAEGRGGLQQGPVAIRGPRTAAL